MLPYEILGIEPGATVEEASKAFRKRGRELAPLIHGDDEQAARAASDELGELILAMNTYGRPAKPEPAAPKALGPGLPALARPQGPRAWALLKRIEVTPSSWDTVA